MKKFFLLSLLANLSIAGIAQDSSSKAYKRPGLPGFVVVKESAATPVKNQSATGTCWSFSTTSLVESQELKNNLGEFNLSEMFTVRNIYIEKARNYILRQGHAQFGEGALGHDVIHSIATYGAVPEAAYSGLKKGQYLHNHKALISNLKQYLDDLLASKPLKEDWMKGFITTLDETLGVPPSEFEYKGVKYTPLSFAKNVLHFNASDYVFLTSFTHHPYYEPFIVEVPDNFSNGSYINIPLNELIQITKEAITKGYSVLWDADVSNTGFNQNKGIAMLTDTTLNQYNDLNLRKLSAADTQRRTASIDRELKKSITEGGKVASNPMFDNGGPREVVWDANLRQTLFENLVTQDDHLMHIVGLEKSPDAKDFFIVKNSWGNVGPDKGYIHVSEPYFAINTITIIVPKAAINNVMLEKMKVR